MRAVPLAVSGPFHTPYMESASNGLREKMATLTYNKMTIPMYSNVTATVYEDNKDAIIDNVTKQVMNPVRWEETLLDMEKKGIDTYIECGPGKVLQGLVKKTLKDVTILGINNMESLEAAANA
jgi:[acyl-carrier-protein] S-malonyltransferase